MSIINYGINTEKRGEINFKYERDLNVPYNQTYGYLLENSNKKLNIHNSLLSQSAFASNKTINKLNNICISFYYDKINDTNIINNQANAINNQNITIENLTTAHNAVYLCNKNEDRNNNYIELDSNDYTIK